MRLINTLTLDLEEYFENQIPSYAILSHTWGDEEATFRDWADKVSAAQKKGYNKIVEACKLARSHGHDYVWIDTNCIDKTSSAELSEAINSMFSWYRSSQVCYAYLSDVHVSTGTSPGSTPDGELLESIRQSRWFTRGWTIQELLAPLQVEFYSEEWRLLGTKESMCGEISRITQINPRYLSQRTIGNRYCANQSSRAMAYEIQPAVPLHKASIADRMSWLSRRKTTRLEDKAYCMLGIFGINMPLLYGEGSRAFRRLQEEIIRVSDDHSIFCWESDLNQSNGFLANTPWDFRNAAGFHPPRHGQDIFPPSPYSLSNSGLHIHLPILSGWASYLAILSIEDEQHSSRSMVGIHIGGNRHTGRMFRKQFPSCPVPLASGVVEFGPPKELFISSDYWITSAESLGHKVERGLTLWAHARRDDTCVESDDFLVERTGHLKDNAEVPFALLTLHPRNKLRRIRTYPPGRFMWEQSSLEILCSPNPGADSDPAGFHWGGRRSNFVYQTKSRRCEAVLLQFEGYLLERAWLLLGMSTLTRPTCPHNAAPFRTHSHWIPPERASFMAGDINDKFPDLPDDPELTNSHPSSEIVDLDSRSIGSDFSNVDPGVGRSRKLSEYIMRHVRWWASSPICSEAKNDRCVDSSPHSGRISARRDKIRVFSSDTQALQYRAGLLHMHIVLRLDAWLFRPESLESHASKGSGHTIDMGHPISDSSDDSAASAWS